MQSHGMHDDMAHKTLLYLLISLEPDPRLKKTNIP